MPHKPHYQVVDYGSKFSSDTNLANLDLPPHLAGVVCSKCERPMIRGNDGRIGCKIMEGKPVCLRETCT